MFDNVRGYVLNMLELPSEWRQIQEQRIPATIERTTVILKHARVEKLREAPIGHLRHEVILAVFVPNRDLARAEDELDVAITEIIASIDGHSTLNWTEAQKIVTPDGQFPGWELTLTVLTGIATPDPPPAPEPPPTTPETTTP